MPSGPIGILLRPGGCVLPRASPSHDPGCVPGHAYYVVSLTPLKACGGRCVLPLIQVDLSPAWVAARAHANRSLLPLMG